ncbi:MULTISPECIES: hypothetical protein [unclassified Pseudomonas]|uniref:hypothetical protein n=1 Tax=Pseudomonadaceae TaxID=135621 RepID=UPI001267BEB3|nr:MULTISPECIES: hypothetical protein [unclassified Pseudomonas]WFC61985.1 hypothetical protein EWH21_09690 [Pseudomonas sp. REST10]|tara:strand:- start:16 stop:468 length:453 start_codon:yes stop_codon:yes gene_type:complete
MNKLVFCFLLFFGFSGYCFSLPWKLDGVWVVDGSLTFSFDQNFSSRDEVEVDIFKCTAELSGLEFSDGKGRYFLRGGECASMGRKGYIEPYDASFSYDVISTEGEQSVILWRGGDLGFQIFNWIDPDLFWVDISESSSVSRYYYRRSLQP